MLQFDHPWIFIFAPFLIAFLFFLIKKDFIPHYQDLFSERQKKLGRLLLFISRSLLVLFLIGALASPFVLKEKTIVIPPSIALLKDTSPSMYPYNLSFLDQWEQILKEKKPVNVFTIPDDFASGLVLGKNYGNLLLISDFHTDEDKLLSTLDRFLQQGKQIGYVKLQPSIPEAAVSIIAKNNALEGALSFLVLVEKSYYDALPLQVIVDGKRVYDGVIGKGTMLSRESLSVSLPKGFHNITAKILPPEGKDHYALNNIAYHVVQVIEKPKLAVLTTKQGTALQQLLQQIYDIKTITSFDQFETLPPDYKHALLLEDYPASKLKPFKELIEDAVFNGLGILVIGGDHSFEYGYKNTFLEDLLPVTIASARKKQNQEVNVVLVIDTSGSTSQSTEGDSALALEKALAIDLLQQTKPNTALGIVAFNNEAEIVQPLGVVDNREQLYEDIASLENKGNTNLDLGLKAAYDMLRNQPGSRNVILLSDGFTLRKYSTERAVKAARQQGIITHVVDLGNRTNRQFLKQIAIWGNGKYFRSENKRSIALIFGTDDKHTEHQQAMNIMTLIPDHFITLKSQSSNATVTGYHQVVPKEDALTLMATIFNNPLVIVGRYGLGKIVVFATQENWGMSLFQDPVFPRSINWVLGSFATPELTIVDKKTSYLVLSKTPQKGFDGENGQWIKIIQKEKYDPGFYQIAGASFAINYPQEFQHVLPNQAILQQLKTYAVNEIKKPEDMLNLAFQQSTKTEIKKEPLLFWFITGAFLLFLIEVTIRRIAKYLALR